MDDVPLVGGKNASLGEMYRNLSAQGVLVPNGFATTAAAFRAFLAHNNLTQRIEDTLKSIGANRTTKVRSHHKDFQHRRQLAKQPSRQL